MPSHSVQVFTIGHATHSPEAFTGLLQKHGITCLADVRSAPYSRFNPQFNRETLAGTLALQGISYIWLGESLGGKRKNGDQYVYDDVFADGLCLLLEHAAMQHTAMMCSEEDPRNCHRHHIISRSLIGSGFPGDDIIHIRGNAQTETAGSIITVRQQKLF